MRQPFRAALILLVVLALSPFAPAQAPPTGQRQGAAAAPAGEALATVNGKAITRSQLQEFLGDHVPNPGEEREDYEDAINRLINDELLTQLLDKQQITITPKEIDDEVAQLEAQWKAQYQSDLKSALAQEDTSMEELRERIVPRLRWMKYVTAQASDANLRKFFTENQDAFQQTKVRASHLLSRVEETASAAEKEKARQKLLQIKKLVDAGKLSFADAANKFSDDEINRKAQTGGDMGYFGRRDGIIEPLAVEAFSLKKGQISDPIATEHGFHLIQVTDRREGTPVKFEDIQDGVKQAYAYDLQMTTLEALRHGSKITIKPMPADLFPKVPALAPVGEPVRSDSSVTPTGAVPKAANPKAAPAR